MKVMLYKAVEGRTQAILLFPRKRKQPPKMLMGTRGPVFAEILGDEILAAGGQDPPRAASLG